MNPVIVGKVLKEVLRWGPTIAKTSKDIYDNTKDMFGKKTPHGESSTTISVQELDKKISQLEQNDLNQAKLLSEMAQQNDNLSKLTNVLAKRFMLAIIIASISLVITIYLLLTIII